MQVNRIATMNVETAMSTDTVKAVAEQMARADVGIVPIVTAEGVPAGVLTDRDVVIRVLAKGLDPVLTPVEAVMSKPVHWIYENAEIEHAARLMSDHLVRRLLVLDHTGSVTGLLSLDDLAVAGCGDHMAARVLEHLARPAVTLR